MYIYVLACVKLWMYMYVSHGIQILYFISLRLFYHHMVETLQVVCVLHICVHHFTVHIMYFIAQGYMYTRRCQAVEM